MNENLLRAIHFSKLKFSRFMFVCLSPYITFSFNVTEILIIEVIRYFKQKEKMQYVLTAKY